MTTNNMTTEILIIGGGIAGASTAYFLAQAGHEVTLFERSELASEASVLNAGTLWQMGWSTSPNLSSTLSMGGKEYSRCYSPILGMILKSFLFYVNFQLNELGQD